MLNRGRGIDTNGSIVSRKKSIIYGSSGLNMNHDARLLTGHAETHGLYLLQSWDPHKVLQWNFVRGIAVGHGDLKNPDDSVGH